jgi:methionyl-tRNA formyltransferase
MGRPETGWRVFLFADYAGSLLPVIRDRLIARGHEITGILTAPPPKSRPNANDFEGVVRAGAEMGIPVIVSGKRKGWAGLLRTFEPDLCICVGLVWKIPADVLAVPRLGTINTHLGALPQYRGPHPVGWVFRNDEGHQGVSIHFMAPEWDAGAVLAQTKVPYDDETDIDDLMTKLIDEAFRMLDLALERLENGESGEEQDESNAGHAPFFEPEWRHVDWAKPRRFIHNQVRSWSGFRDSPRGAIGAVDSESMIVCKTRLVTGIDADGASPGAVLSRDDGGIVVQCGDGPLQIIEWESAPQ